VSRLGGGTGTGRLGGDGRGGGWGEAPAVWDFMFCHALKTFAGSAGFFLLVGAGFGKFVNRSAPEAPDAVLRHVPVGLGVRLGGGGKSDFVWYMGFVPLLLGGTLGLVKAPPPSPAFLRSASYLVLDTGSWRISCAACIAWNFGTISDSLPGFRSGWYFSAALCQRRLLWWA
jgi:hypothetical protein